MLYIEWIFFNPFIFNIIDLFHSNLINSSILMNENVISLLIVVCLSVLSGITVGFTLGLIGGGGSILAVPILVYVIGIDTHIAIGTSALAVAINSLINLFFRRGTGGIKIQEGILFAIPGTFGTLIGAQLGLLTSSENLLILFSLFMIIISLWMLKGKTNRRNQECLNDAQILTVDKKDTLYINNTPNKKNKYLFLRNIRLYDDIIKGTIYNLQKIIPFLIKSNTYYKILLNGFLVGIAAGYFGIGGGFLIVPALIHSVSGINIIEAIGTSLIPIASFGFVTATKYVLNGQINWYISFLFIVGGIMGGLIGTNLSKKLPTRKLSKIFSIVLIIVAVYIIIKILFH